MEANVKDKTFLFQCNRGVDLANPPRHCPECLQKKKKSKVKLKVFNGELKIFCKNEEVKDRISNFRV